MYYGQETSQTIGKFFYYRVSDRGLAPKADKHAHFVDCSQKEINTHANAIKYEVVLVKKRFWDPGK